MAFWEASQSPPRHSTHHRRRHHQPRDENKYYQVSNDRPCLKHPRKQHKSDLAIGNSNTPSQPHTRYDMVENWLAQTARQSPHSCPRTSQGHRREDAHSHHPSKPLGAKAPYNKHPRHVDPKWSPRHGFPADSLPQSDSPFRDISMRDQRKSRRRRITTSDSSFISGFENSTRPPGHGPGPIPHVRKNIPPARSPREASLAPPDASSITSHVSEQMNFEKRPRHKTKEDKYETKKKKRDHEREGSGSYEEHRRKKRKKANKRKSMASSKNIVNNFTSDAVLNDRITVQPHLRPGLFENGRTSKKQPISDLAFSGMQFLRHQKRNPQPKPLSKSRLREKRREDRELEEVSSFFLPHGPDRNNRTPRGHIPNSGNNHQDMDYQARQFPSTRFQEVSVPSSSDHLLDPSPVRISRPRDDTVGKISPKPYGYIDDGKDSGKSTAYFTWSATHHSPHVSRRADSSSPDLSGSAWTTTPEGVRRDLIATGIYRDTGIPLYDDHLAEQNIKRRKMNVKIISARRVDPEDNIHSSHHEFNGPQKVQYRDQAVMTESPPKSPEPTLRTQEMEEYRAHPQVSQIAQETDRQKIVRDVRLNPTRKDIARTNMQTPNLPGAEATRILQAPESAGTDANQNVERMAQETSDPISVTSRDVMPPPPIPHGRNISIVSSHANTREAGPAGPAQTTPPSNAETEKLQASCIVSHNDATQNVQGLPEGSTQTTASSESTINDEHILSSLDTASWIPQRTPSARTVETQSIISRLSMRSPFYVDQHDRTSSVNSYQKDLIRSRGPESIAEFIARIENESQQQTLLYNDDSLDPEFSLDNATRDLSTFDRELSEQQFSAYDERENMSSHLDPNPRLSYTDMESPGMYYQGGGEYYIETQHPQYGLGTPRAFPDVTQPSEDLEEESFEMSNFWRPNQLSRF
ncbi:hypothetical protein F4805DRAFT_323600 [Annulohypoxylon moriforme]|nr:hypothetical protein F4805DRAFT_323600 [Annulohypoxylon moriforme]